MQQAGQAMMEQLQEQMARQQGEGPGGQPQAERPARPRSARPGDPQRWRHGHARRRGAGGERSRPGARRAGGALSPRRRPQPAAARARLLPASARPVLSRLRRVDRPSPNCDARPAGRARSTCWCCTIPGMRSAAAALDRLCDPAAKVSAHYLIDEDGTVVALVPETSCAPGMPGASWWQGRAGAQRRLARHRARQSRPRVGLPPIPRGADGGAAGAGDGDRGGGGAIPPDRVVGHSDIAPDAQGGSGRAVRLGSSWHGPGLCLRARTPVPAEPDAARGGGSAGTDRLSRRGAGRAARCGPARVPAPLAAGVLRRRAGRGDHGPGARGCRACEPTSAGTT